jgi:hypothetical protein
MTRVVEQPGIGAARLKAALKAFPGLEGKVGWFASAKYENGTQVALVAAVQEYGYAPKHIPPRMGLRAMIPEKQESWAQFAKAAAKKVLVEGAAPEEMFLLVGARAEADIRRQIASVTSPPLAFATQDARARRRGIEPDELTATGAKPLVDTSLMYSTVSNIVEKDGALVAGKVKTKIGDDATG